MFELYLNCITTKCVYSIAQYANTLIDGVPKKTIVSYFWLLLAVKHLFKIQSVLLSTILLTGLSFNKNLVSAQTVLSCIANDSQPLDNRASVNYMAQRQSISNRLELSAAIKSSPEIKVINNESIYEEKEFANVLGIITDSLIDEFIQQGLNSEEADSATLVTLSQWASLPNSSSIETLAAIEENLIVKLGEERTELIAKIPDSLLLTILTGLHPSTLATIGLLPTEIKILSQIEVTPQKGSFV